MPRRQAGRWVTEKDDNTDKQTYFKFSQQEIHKILNMNSFEDSVKEDIPSCEVLLEKAKKGQILIGINTNAARYIYFQLTSNIFVRLYHFFVTIYFHPLTAILLVIILVINKSYWEILLYFIIGASFVILENDIIRYTVKKCVLKDNSIFEELYKTNIITLKDISSKSNNSKQ